VADVFLDANVLVYAFDSRYPEKQKIAAAVLAEAVVREITVSVQVLSEFSNVMLHRRRPAAKPEHIRRFLESFGSLTVIAPDFAMIHRALDAHREYGVHFYDGMIVAAAERGGCTQLWSEDFNHGQRYFGIEVINPFA
jgi:predicted nucleic acid-binding protein